MISFAIFTDELNSFFNIDTLEQSEHLSSTILMRKIFSQVPNLYLLCFKFLHHKSIGLRCLKKLSKNGSVASRVLVATGLIIMRSVSEDFHLQFMQLLKIFITQLYARLSNSSLHLDNLNRSDQIIQFFPQFSHTFSAHSSIS